MTLEIQIPGPPVAYMRVGTSRRVPPRERAYRNHVRSCAHVELLKARRERFLGPVQLELEVYQPTRKMADCTNLAKSVEDAFNGIVWIDDTQVVSLRVTRRLDRGNPRAVARITSLDWPPDEDLPSKAQRTYVEQIPRDHSRRAKRAHGRRKAARDE